MSSAYNVLDDYYDLFKRVFSELETAERDAAQCVSQQDLLADIRVLAKRVKEEAQDEYVVKEVEVPALSFIDWLIGTSRVPFADSWLQSRPAAGLVNNQAGDDRFAASLTHAVENNLTEELPLYYLALSMGYRGSMEATAASELHEQIRNKLSSKQVYSLDASAYLRKHPVEKRDFTISPSERVWLVVLIASLLLISGGAFTVFKYMNATADLNRTLDKVAGRSQQQ